MSISRAQQILLKRAQREAGLDDPEYREALALVSGCRSSTDPKLTDRGVDLALAYFEAIYWRRLDAGELPPTGKADAVFRQRGFWAQRNPSGNTSRDRYQVAGIHREIAELEAALKQIGFGQSYCDAIRKNVTHGGADGRSLWLYKAALERTLRSKQKQFAGVTPAQTSRS
jgi:hypothetical protein